MPTSICAAQNPDNNRQPLSPRQARALVAALSRKAEENIAADMVADYLDLHPATPTVTTQPPVNACPSPDKKAGSTTATHPYRYDRSRLTPRPTTRSGYHFDTDAPRSFPFTAYHTTTN